MKYKKGDKILQINNGVFIRLGLILSVKNNEYEIEWIRFGNHIANLTKIKKYPVSFIHNEIFDLINKDNINNVMNKYINNEDYETCKWINNNNILTKNMKKYLLTDFNTDRWKGINMESVKSEVEKLNEKTNKNVCLYGQIGNPTTFDISMSKASHALKNFTFEDGKVYGDVKFLDNKNGKQADNLINNKNCRFGIRSTGTSEQYKDGEIVIHSIFTWDIITE